MHQEFCESEFQIGSEIEIPRHNCHICTASTESVQFKQTTEWELLNFEGNVKFKETLVVKMASQYS